VAITQTMTTSFKELCLDDTKTYKVALYFAATMDATTTAYTATNEVVGTGYVAGGNTIVPTTTSTGTTAFLDFPNSVWSNATIAADGCMIYLSEAGNPSVALYDFGGTRTSTAADFTVTFPAADATNAVVRIA
jgi:hypothetical protein